MELFFVFFSFYSVENFDNRQNMKIIIKKKLLCARVFYFQPNCLHCFVGLRGDAGTLRDGCTLFGGLANMTTSILKKKTTNGEVRHVRGLAVLAVGGKHGVIVSLIELAVPAEPAEPPHVSVAQG